MKPLTAAFLLALVPAIAWAHYPPGAKAWRHAVNDIGNSLSHTLENNCHAMKFSSAMALSKNQAVDMRCEDAEIISSACEGYAASAGGMLLDLHSGKYTPKSLWENVLNSPPDGSGNGLYSAESAIYAPVNMTAGDLTWRDYRQCMRPHHFFSPDTSKVK